MDRGKGPLKFLLALRIKHLRSQKGLSLKQLSEKCGLSSSYLNEIEKSKKLPKMEKLALLAESLEVDLEQLLSKNVDESLRPLVQFFESRFFRELPLEIFGISHLELFDLISIDPVRFSSLISALGAMTKSYDLKLDDIHASTLRVLQESRKNYFEDLEFKANEFRGELRGVIKESSLKNYLIEKLDYEIIDDYLDKTPGLMTKRSLYLDGKKKRLFINRKLLLPQRIFVLAKEIAFNVLQMEREEGKSSFNPIWNEFRASYFSGALIMNSDEIVEDMKILFSKKRFEEKDFKRIMVKYGASSEVFFNRLTQILPKFFGLNEIFFLKIESEKGHDNLGNYDITKELHFSKVHAPHGIGLNEHYCRRWITITLLKELEHKRRNDNYKKPLIGIQKSKMVNDGSEYFVVSIARPSRLKDHKNTCLTLGIHINEDFKNKVNFWNDPLLTTKEVSQTCERCEKEDCEQRVTPPYMAIKKREKELMDKAIYRLKNTKEAQLSI